MAVLAEIPPNLFVFGPRDNESFESNIVLAVAPRHFALDPPDRLGEAELAIREAVRQLENALGVDEGDGLPPIPKEPHDEIRKEVTRLEEADPRSARIAQEEELTAGKQGRFGARHPFEVRDEGELA